MHKLMQNADNRKTFIDSAIDFVRLHKFDGFDFNWIPDTETKSDFVTFFQEFRQSIDAESDLNRQSPLLLTLGVPPGIDRIEAGYDGKALAESVDWMNVMTFDYHGQWENKTGFNSPLFDRDGDRLSINSTMMYLTENQEIPKDKLVIGFATYGRGWTLPSTSEPNSIPSPTIGLSPAQPFTLVPGVAAYFEICTLIEKENFTEKFDEMQDVPFIFDNGIWIGYDDPKSYDQKLDWLIDNDFAGAFVWALDMDDFLGRCSSSNGTYPLVKTVRSKLTRKE
jgi:chitinase